MMTASAAVRMPFKKYHGFVGSEHCFVDVEWIDK
jgi:hypothetical protein